LREFLKTSSVCAYHYQISKKKGGYKLTKKCFCWNGFEGMGGKAMEDGYIQTGGRISNRRSEGHTPV
jgi:hypothetical protein